MDGAARRPVRKRALDASQHFPYFAACSAVFDACTDVVGSLTDDELVFAAFVRHVNAHVFQDGFEYQLEGEPEEEPTCRCPHEANGAAPW
jgi:hypothetical protein